jgi:hypothetical protein
MLLARKNAAAAGTRVPKLIRHAWFVIAVVWLMLVASNLCWADEDTDSSSEEEEEEEDVTHTDEHVGHGDIGSARTSDLDVRHYGQFGQRERKYPPGRLGTLCKNHDDFLSNTQNRFGGYYGGMHWYPDTNNIPENCTSATENARGTYTAHKADCIFSFHKVKRPTAWSEYSLSTDCKNSNLLRQETKDGKGEGAPKSFKMKAEAFPDQCVKDYKRCYSIDDDWKHYLSFFCKNERSIPDDATHVSVDCTEDFVIKLGLWAKMLSRNGSSEEEGLGSFEKSIQNQEKVRHDHEIRKFHMLATRAEKLVYAVVGVGLVACFSCACFVYAGVVRPFQQSQLDSGLRRRRTGGRGVTLPFSVSASTAAARRPRSKVGVSTLPTTH